jgi:hypothetical protein
VGSLNEKDLNLKEIFVSPFPSLDEKCGKNFHYRDFFECGETFQALRTNNVPNSKKTYEALRELAQTILDPVWDEFGPIELTYGLSCPSLFRHIDKRIYPPRDQHASYELNNNGNLVCPRGGAAADFRCSNISSLHIAQWTVKNCPFDRFYFYGIDRPIHVSIGPDKSSQITLMQFSATPDRRIPRNISIEDFLGLNEEDHLVVNCSVKNGKIA